MEQLRSGARTIAIAAVAVATLAAFVAEPALAAKKRGPRATISACAGTGVTITVAALPAKGAKVSGARLELQFTAVPQRGAVRRGNWIAVGQKRSAVRSHAFGSLPAGPWAGSVRYRWRRGSKTVASGVARTEEATIGKANGRGACVLVDRSAGVQQQIAVDRDPPVLGVSPAPDQTWKRAPVTVSFSAFDASSGIASVDYTVNGVPGQGRSVTLSSEGEYDIRAVARDLAGNVSNEARTFVRIDETPPSVPAVTLPDAASPSDNTPRVRWTPSTDARSGLAGYTVTVTGGGQSVPSQQVPPGTQEVTLPKLANSPAGQPYRVWVAASDSAQSPPNSVSSAESSFTVDNVVFSEDFSGGCASPPWTFGVPNQFGAANPWSCTTGALRSSSARQCPNDSTYTATGPQLAYVANPGEPMRLSFVSSLDPGTVTGTRRVEVMVGNTSIASTTGTSVTYTEPATKPSFRFTHQLSNGGGFVCGGPADSRLEFDNLKLERNPLP